MRTTTELRRLVTRPEVAFLMEAHDGLSARVAEETGFEGNLGERAHTLSASFGVRDNNELSWTQVVDHVAFMAEACAVLVLLDGDTGYGNFNNMAVSSASWSRSAWPALRDLLNRVLAAGHSVRVVYGRGGWVNVNDVAGLVDASGL